MPAASVEHYRKALRQQLLSAVGRGYGSAIFLEFGNLLPRHKRDGSLADPHGEYTVMIEWSWRIESEDAIICGSWSDEANQEDVLKSLIGRSVEDVWTFGRLPELCVALTGGIYVTSFMTAEGQPEWTIIEQSHEGKEPRSISVENGRVVEGH